LGNPITMNSNAATSGKCTLIKKLLSTRDNTNIQISGLTGSVKLIIKIKKVLNIV
jgi:guanylate kinase